VLLAKITPCFENGKLGIARGLTNGIGFGSSEYFVLRPNDSLSGEYLYYFLSQDCFRAEGEKTMSGAVGHKRVSKEFIERCQIPLPPISEQQRIVAILDKAFAGLATVTANAEKNLKNARELFESQLSQAFNKVAQQQGSRRLAEIVTRLTNGYVGPTRNIYLQSGVPYLLARHVRDNQLEFDGKTFISNEFNEKHKKSKLKAGDVLLVQSGHIGHSAVVGPDHEGHNCHAMIVITPIADKLAGDFLSYFFGSPRMKRKFEEIRSGSTVPHLTCGLVRELMIPLPEVAEQNKLAAVLKGLEENTARLASIAEAKLFNIDQLRQSILHKAFSGELTSPPSQAVKEAAE
jgi:type I restriction enzyme, S subunit